MKFHASIAVIACTALPGGAQEVSLPPAPAVATGEIGSAAQLLPPEIPAAERQIRAGLVLLRSLCIALAAVQDRESAQASIPTIVRITRELQTWAQGMAALPPLSEEERSLYEMRYLPIIGQMNDLLRVQGERLAASDYFGSQDLATALISLYSITQQ